jgi:hypothetical protein
MLTIDDLAQNHRRIYEAARDAGKAVSPSELEELTGIAGTTVRPTVRAMEERGYLERVGYGMYRVVPLDQINSAHDTGLSPARSTVQNPTPTHHDLITSRSEGDMTYDPSWVVPILLSAHIAMMHRDDLEKARTMKEAGRRFRVRLVVEEEDKPPENIPPQK